MASRAWTVVEAWNQAPRSPYNSRRAPDTHPRSLRRTTPPVGRVVVEPRPAHARAQQPLLRVVQQAGALDAGPGGPDILRDARPVLGGRETADEQGRHHHDEHAGRQGGPGAATRRYEGHVGSRTA
ncbi:hypothetical protein OG906_30235 [Streptomyces sp. NBC_01426]|uniref:hypothetical protein n=1 Tax=Streptomyces sp. NBC_01426 TaxID=2975866 RepID=UPI002E34849F|nr:hypothetical protein [Streptomyces sp. NBC_01426]